MRRIGNSRLTGGMLLMLCLSPALLLAQQPANANRALVTSDLIAWTDMQSPHPIPGFSAEVDPAAAANRDQRSQTFTGTICQQGQSFILRISDQAIYELDDMNEAGRYQGRRVAVLGALQPGKVLIHVYKIEPVS